MSLSEKRHIEEEGTAVAWALIYLRFGSEAATERVREFNRSGGSRTALERIKRRMWQHIKANRVTPEGGDHGP